MDILREVVENNLVFEEVFVVVRRAELSPAFLYSERVVVAAVRALADVVRLAMILNITVIRWNDIYLAVER